MCLLDTESKQRMCLLDPNAELSDNTFMPANTTPFPTHIDRTRTQSKKLAAVLEFNSDDLIRVNDFLRSLHDRGITTRLSTAQTFNPTETSAELYFP